MMTVKGLLISWATPAARRPTEASFSASTSWRWFFSSAWAIWLKLSATSVNSPEPATSTLWSRSPSARARTLATRRSRGRTMERCV